MRLRLIGALGALIALVVLTALGTGSAVGAAKGEDRLSKHDRALLAEQRAAGDSTTTLLFATARGSADSVAKSVEALGGSVEYRDDALGYVRASVPLDKAGVAAGLDGVSAVDVDEVIPLPSPRPEADEPAPAVDPPGPGTPGQNPYMPTRDIGAPQFVAANPSADGRGMTIGIVDTGIDVLTPELQTAKKDDGKSVPKFADWVTGTDPLTEDDPTWVLMNNKVKADDGSFTFNGSTYTTPQGYDDSDFSIGLFNERDPRLGGELGNDVNRDGNPAGSSGLFTVIWDGSDKVWVDTNQNLSFADQQMMQRYSKEHDVGVFGTDNPATPVRETVPFVVQPDKDTNTVNIGIVSGAHGTHVAGIAAGKDFFGGQFDGVAPEARIVSLRACLFITGCTSHALFEGMIWLAKEAKVDVINMSIGGLPALNDGNNARAILYSRLIDDEKVQMFISAGNSGPGVNTVGDPSVATKVMSVAAYVHKDTWMSNYAADAVKTDGMFVFSSRGPREDGGFKPNISAPGAAVSSIPAWQAGSPVAGTYALPPGYGMFNGTSMAAPQATGAAALLLSAAKFYGAEAKPDQLRQALNSSARFIDNYQAHEQGTGLINVGAAWDLLKTKEVKPSEYTSTAPVSTVLSGFLATPNQGPGIYEREGWSIGETGVRTITLSRINGGEQVNLSWKGNDGTFGAVPSSLNLKQSASINVAIGPVTAGIHSAILNVDDPKTVGIDYQILNAVVAAEEFNAGNNFSVTTPGTADRPDRAVQRFFYFVPAGTPAFKVDVVATTGRIRVLRQHPFGVPFDNTNTTQYCTAPCTTSRTASNPAPGVWEVAIDTSRTSPTAVSTFQVTASILGVVINPASWTVDPATIGTTYTQSFSFTNNYGSFTGGAVGSSLGSAITARPTIANLEQQTFEVDIPAGSTSLTVRIGNPSDAAADLDLFVFRPNGTLAGSNADGDSEETVTVNPSASPGTWTVLVDGFAVPAGTTAYDYLDVFAHSSFGSVSVTDPPALRASGATWSTTASTTPLAKPAAGRFLQGFVRVTSGGSILGSAEVQLKNVGP